MTRSRFSWAEPETINNKGLKVAAVNPQTHMIEGIWPNVIAASNDLTNKNQNYYAKQIGKALNNFHLKVLGYWWKRIN